MKNLLPVSLMKQHPISQRNVLVSDAAWRLMSWCVYAVLCGIQVVWLVVDVLPYRTPPVYDEADYLMGTLRLWDMALKTPWHLISVPCDISHFLSHRSLVASCVTTLIGLLTGRSYATFYISATVMIATATLLMFLSVKFIVADVETRAIHRVVTIVCFILSPVVLLSGGVYLAEAPWALMLALSFWSYLRARASQKVSHWIVAAVILSACIYVRAERGINVIVVMQAMFLLDVFALQGWRAGMLSVVVQTGVASLGFLAVGYSLCAVVSERTALLLTIGALVSSLTLVPLVRLKLEQIKVPLMYAGIPSGVVTFILLCYDNAENFVNTLKMFLDVNAAYSGVFAYPFARRYALELCGSKGAFVLCSSLALAGIFSAARIWPGLLGFLMLNVLTYARLNPYVDARYLWQFHFGWCYLCGGGAAQLLQWLSRWRVLQTYRYSKHAMVMVMACFILAAQCWDLFPRSRSLFSWAFDPTRALHAVLQHMRGTIPPGSDVSITPFIRGFESSSLNAYSALNRLEWRHVTVWPESNTLTVLDEHYRRSNMWPKYLVSMLPGQDSITSKPAARKELYHAHEVIRKAAHYQLVSTFTSTPSKTIVCIHIHTNWWPSAVE